MVSLQGLHTSNAFRCSNVSVSAWGLKSFCPWCLKLGGNTEMQSPSILDRCITGLQLCVIYASCHCTSMNTQSILEYCSGCKAKCDKECTGAWGTGKGTIVTQEVAQGPWHGRRCPNYPAQRSPRNHKECNTFQHLPTSPARGCRSQFSSWIFLDHPGCIVQVESSLWQINYHFFF